MSSIHAFRTPTGFAILSDGSVIDLKSGILERIEPKVWAGTNFAVGMMGHPADNALVVSLIATLTSFDDAEDFLTAELAAKRQNPPHGPLWLSLPLAGWSDRRRAWTMLVANVGHEDPNFEPWSLNEIDGVEFSRGPVVPLDELKQIFAGLSQFDEAGLRDRGAAYFEAQRRVKMQTPGFASMHMVGGFVDLTIVDDAGARQERLRTWPDVVGRLIDP
jgi:hypothetical protein